MKIPNENPFAASGAFWIQPAGDLSPDSFECFRKVFFSDEIHAELFISADTDFIIYLDGQEIFRGQFPDYRHRKTWTAVPLNLQRGTHVLAILVYACGKAFSTGVRGCMSMICTLKQGPRVLLSSDCSWKAKLHSSILSGIQQIRTSQLGFVMTIDARKEEDWTAKNFDDRSWPYAVPWIPSDGICRIDLEQRPVPPPRLCGRTVFKPVKAGWISRTKEYPSYAQTVSQGDRIAFESLENVFDTLPDGDLLSRSLPNFPENNRNAADTLRGFMLISDTLEENTGFIEIEIKAPEGTLIDISHGEHLADGTVRAFVGGRNFTDRLICHDGWNSIAFPFRRIGARYLQIHVFPPDPAERTRIRYLGIQRFETALPPLTSFTAVPRGMTDHLRETAARTLLMCMHDHYEDCPWREQSLYAYDSRNQMLFGYCLWGNYPFARASLDLLGKGMGDNGLLNMCAPNEPGSLKIILFSHVWISAVREYTLYSGDFSLFRKYRSQIQKMVHHILQKTDPDTGLLLEPFGQDLWNFTEWVPGLEGVYRPSAKDVQRFSAPYNAYAAEALESCADLLQMDSTNSDEEEAYLRKRILTLKQAVHQAFFIPAENLYASFVNPDRTLCSERHLHTQYLMLSLEITPDPLKQAVFQASLQGHMPFSFSPLLYQMRALTEISPASRKYVREYADSKFCAMLHCGATTFWEVEEGEKAFSKAGSLCHAWSSIHAWYYGTVTLGIRPAKPGFREFFVRIDPGTFQSASGDMPVPGGVIHCEWTRNPDGSLNVSIVHPQACHPLFQPFEEAPYANVRTESV